jgi:hyperosmotically inducible protein
MRNHLLRNSVLAAALVGAFAAVPLNQALAQYATPQTQESTDNQTVPDKAADAWITAKVKSELATAKNVKASDIDVDTSDSMVTLSGMVSTSSEKMRAVDLAKAVKGVKSVDASNLRVSGMDTDHPMPKTDHPMSDMPARSASAGH